jgi:hypothetical protein
MVILSWVYGESSPKLRPEPDGLDDGVKAISYHHGQENPHIPRRREGEQADEREDERREDEKCGAS